MFRSLGCSASRVGLVDGTAALARSVSRLGAGRTTGRKDLLSPPHESLVGSELTA